MDAYHYHAGSGGHVHADGGVPHEHAPPPEPVPEAQAPAEPATVAPTNAPQLPVQPTDKEQIPKSQRRPPLLGSSGGSNPIARLIRNRLVILLIGLGVGAGIGTSVTSNSTSNQGSILSTLADLETTQEPTVTDEGAIPEEVAQEPVETTRRPVVGDAITLRGQENERMRITLVSVVDPARSSNSFLQPGSDKRYVAFKIRLKNVGSVAYSDSPSNGAAVVDTQDREYGAEGSDPVEPGLGSPKIRPGDTRLGYITFEVPRSAQLRTFQFTLSSGFADETGEWTL